MASQIQQNRERASGIKNVAKKYSRLIHQDAKDNLKALNIGVEGDLDESLKASLGYDKGDVNRVSLKHLRYGAFVEMGVGRGYPIETVRGNALRLGARKPKPWVNPVLDERQPQMADELMEINADASVKALRIGSTSKSIVNG